LRFTVDERSWQTGTENPSQWLNAFEAVLDVLDDALERHHTILYSEHLFAMEITAGRSFYELYDDLSELRVPPDVRLRVAAVFSKASRWEDCESEPSSFNVNFEGCQIEYVPSVAWCHQQYHHAEYVCCVSGATVRSAGENQVFLNGTPATVWFATTVRDAELFFRWIIVKTTKTPDQMANFASDAFRRLKFSNGVFDGIKKMSAPYLSLVERLVKNLGVLSDEGERIFRGSWRDASAQFGALGVQISDENGKTKSNSKARKARTLIVEGSELQFWWHIKIHPDRDRIHIYPDGVHSGKHIFVGIFCNHLTV
jgi:hypothetical protein